MTRPYIVGKDILWSIYVNMVKRQLAMTEISDVPSDWYGCHAHLGWKGDPISIPH